MRVTSGAEYSMEPSVFVESFHASYTESTYFYFSIPSFSIFFIIHHFSSQVVCWNLPVNRKINEKAGET